MVEIEIPDDHVLITKEEYERLKNIERIFFIEKLENAIKYYLSPTEEELIKSREKMKLELSKK